MILLNLICKQYLIDERLNNYEIIKTARDIPQFSSQFFQVIVFIQKEKIKSKQKKKRIQSKRIYKC